MEEAPGSLSHHLVILTGKPAPSIQAEPPVSAFPLVSHSPPMQRQAPSSMLYVHKCHERTCYFHSFNVHTHLHTPIHGHVHFGRLYIGLWYEMLFRATMKGSSPALCSCMQQKGERWVVLHKDFFRNSVQNLYKKSDLLWSKN